MYLNHDEIQDLLREGQMLYSSDHCVNTASLDVRLGDTILVERGDRTRVVDYRKRQPLEMETVCLPPEGLSIPPGAFFLAHTIEHCNFSDDTAALFRSKSSMGRIGLEHMDAGWVDPGFHGALTLEFCNMTRHHSILLRPGDRIGQLIFFKGREVAETQSYRTTGNYNGFDGIAQVRYRNGC